LVSDIGTRCSTTPYLAAAGVRYRSTYAFPFESPDHIHKFTFSPRACFRICCQDEGLAAAWLGDAERIRLTPRTATKPGLIRRNRDFTLAIENSSYKDKYFINMGTQLTPQSLPKGGTTLKESYGGS
jgi:hypothetical protein